MNDRPVVLVCKCVPPGASSLPPTIVLVPGDELTITVEEYGDDVDMRWTSSFAARMVMRIEFDYMEIRDPGPTRGAVFTEVSHTATGGPE